MSGILTIAAALVGAATYGVVSGSMVGLHPADLQGAPRYRNPVRPDQTFKKSARKLAVFQANWVSPIPPVIQRPETNEIDPEPGRPKLNRKK